MDSSSAIAVAKIVIPKTPFLLKTAAAHTLGLSETSSKWDLKSELTIRLVKALIDTPRPSTVSRLQKISLKDPGIKGPLWISKVAVPAPAGVLKDVLGAVDALKDDKMTYDVPEVLTVEAEWTGHRSGVGEGAARPDLPEDEQYRRLMAETKSETTVLYFHGGAMYLMDPASHRPLTMKLAKDTGGRCFSVRYRLSPQNPFPAALVDAYVAYLSLLHPPEGAYHDAVPADKIVFCGDSAGGMLSLALLQLLLQLNKMKLKAGETPIPLPAGLGLMSPWCDTTSCLPSVVDNARFDYLPRLDPATERKQPECELWPTEPPREFLYCDGEALDHPLVSPLAARDWSGSPPVFMAVGSELLTDEGKVVAQLMHEQGVTVQFSEWEAMPHCFAMMLKGAACSRKCIGWWSSFITDATTGAAPGEKATYVYAKTLKEEDIQWDKLGPVTAEETWKKMGEAKAKRIDNFLKRLEGKKSKL